MHLALARAQLEQARPYGAGLPETGDALGSIFPSHQLYFLSSLYLDMRSGIGNGMYV